MKKLVLLIPVLLFLTKASAQEVDPAYRATLKQMLEASGAQETFKAAVGQMITMYKQNMTDVPAEVWNEFGDEFLKTSLDDLVTLLAPIYQKHLSKADLEKVIEFYKSPAGKRFAEKSPFITQESMMAGQQWGQQLGEKLIARLKEKGY